VHRLSEAAIPDNFESGVSSGCGAGDRTIQGRSDRGLAFSLFGTEGAGTAGGGGGLKVVAEVLLGAAEKWDEDEW